MRRTSVCLLAVLAVLVTGWVLAAPATACSCTGAPLARQVDRADAVFTGRLVSREVRGGWSTPDPALHVFSVEAVWKGSVAAEQGVVSAASGASCGLELAGEGPFLVLATGSADLDGGQLSADLCGGTTTWTPVTEAGVRAATGLDAPAGPRPGAAGTEFGGQPLWGRLALAAAGVGALGLLGATLLRRRGGRR
ncbi:hypothetical protein ACI78V_04330 [Geodermatophilus sp. SYSU D00742]